MPWSQLKQMDDIISYIIGDFPVTETYEKLPNIFPKVNLTNFHSSIWAILYTHRDSFRGNNRKLIDNTLALLDETVDPQKLYDIMMEDSEFCCFDDYAVDKSSALSYAKIITSALIKENH